jgi:quercetin dioxygenase-like cupin family protein
MKFETQMRSELESAEGLEVVVSVVEIPPATKLPVHTHPGEEFAYVLEGSFVLWQEGKDDVRLKAGDTGKVPLNQVHTTFTEDEAAKIVVFRVHKKGEPERLLVE